LEFNLSNLAAVDFLSTIIKSCGGDLKDFPISEPSVRRHKNQTSKEIAEKVKREWYPPDFPCLHWDEKEVTRNKKKQKRLEIAISGDERKPKHLGSFVMKDGTGKSTAKTVVEACGDWGMTPNLPETVPAMQIFDTCKANTGNGMNRIKKEINFK
jgi:hypothetical protein